MSNKQELQKALEVLAKAKKETTNEVNKIVKNTRQVRQEAEEQSSRQD